MKKIIMAALLGTIMALGGCCNAKLDSYKDTTPPIAIKDFFTGNIKGWGIVQDRSGKVTRRFDIAMEGHWHGNEGTLEEHFSYYDGKKQHRIWHIRQLADGTFEGTAPDIIGKATGRENGSAIQWSYVMEVPVDDTTYRLTFDDWMFRMNGGTLMNRSYMKKFGVKVAELTIFMQKQ